MAKAKEQGSHLIVGLTGGIASGKTTVSRMLEERGIPVIDFDLIARQIVEPGKPALKEIVAYFGDRVLEKNRHLDRKCLSRIVFQDARKRKKLEKMTHPRIIEAFQKQVDRIIKEDPHTIIQVVVPLLFEADLQHLVDRILLVYVPPNIQLDRLTRRNGIRREEAERMLKAQWPIDEKQSRADLIIHNEGSMEETRKQVDDVCRTLRQIQTEKRKESTT
jgi:dephospho-CoA kinase